MAVHPGSKTSSYPWQELKGMEAGQQGLTTEGGGTPAFNQGIPGEAVGQVRPGGGQRKEGEYWSSKAEFYMVALGATTGLAKLWRFPYLCYRHGGVAFLLPYILSMVFLGFPIIALELAIGQYSGRGVIGVWNLSPIFKGIGWTFVVINWISLTYHTVFLAYGVLYTAASMAPVIPWTNCIHQWNTERCISANAPCAAVGMKWDNITGACQGESYGAIVSPAEEFFTYVLGLSPGVDDMGGVQWHLALSLLLVWILIVVTLSFGVKSWGKVAYVTTLLPMVLLFILLVQASAREGAHMGIKYFMVPHGQALADYQAWLDAAVSVLFTAGCGWGNYITIAKYNKFNTNVLRDAGLLVLLQLVMALFCGFMIFAILGHMANELGIAVADVATAGPGLAFIMIPRAMTVLPYGRLWSILFFLMVVSLGLGAVIPAMATIHVAISESFPKFLSTRLRQAGLLVVLAAFTYLFGLPYITNGGTYLLQFVDMYGPNYAVMLAVLCEVLVVAWIYGPGKLQKALYEMTGSRATYFCGLFNTVSWNIISPLLILVIFILSMIRWSSLRYGGYTYPWGADLGGLFLTLFILSFIPILALFYIITHRRMNCRRMFSPAESWGPRQ